jgi:predicted DCC family thiol-disulfide oxidoreductase YuxK
MLIVHLFTYNPQWLAPQVELAGSNRPILFYDGTCGMCNTFVQWVLRFDTQGAFMFAPLQGATAQHSLSEEYTRNLQTVVVKDVNGICHTHSTAIISVCRIVGGVWSFGVLLCIVPKIIRDVAYRFIAAHRHKIFPGVDACRLLTEEERKRFLP